VKNKKCHTKHLVLELGMGEILGASCSMPRKGFDIYIGFCYTMTFTHQPYPWETKDDPVVEFKYEIQDMHAPKDAKEFKLLINWVAEQLEDGKRIHVGCIGGHGRTGTFLAALVSLYEDLTDDPIAYVREHHCKKAVESKDQIDFLVKHFGCKTAKASKTWSGSTGRRDWTGDDWQAHWASMDAEAQVVPFTRKGTSKRNRSKTILPVHGKGSIWG
jgi:hypothetical protein